MGPEAEDAARTRPSKLTVAAGFLYMLRDRSTCKRARVAAIVCDRDFKSIYAMGYNGPAAGEDNDACRNEQGNCGCVHAEANALVKLRTTERSLSLLSSTAPCELCARLIVNCGAINLVAYLEDYRSTFGTDILKKAGITVGRLQPPVLHERISRSFAYSDHVFVESL